MYGPWFKYFYTDIHLYLFTIRKHKGSGTSFQRVGPQDKNGRTGQKVRFLKCILIFTYEYYFFLTFLGCVFTGNTKDSWLLWDCLRPGGPGEASSHYSPAYTWCFWHLRLSLHFLWVPTVISVSTLLFMLFHSATPRHTLLPPAMLFYLSPPESHPFFKVFLHEVSQIVAFGFILSPSSLFHLHRHFLPTSNMSGTFSVFP